MYVLLYGAKKNAGDFLIYERARELIRALKPGHELLELPRWKPLGVHLDMVNLKARAIIICGGPGYDARFSPVILPLANDLSRIHVPIVPLALGWAGKGEPDQFAFTAQSLNAIREIHRRIPFSSVRDVLTQQILNRMGISNVLMSGCTAWYSLPHIALNFTPPERIRRIVVTTPTKSWNMSQAARLLDAVRRRFPDVERYLVFHRGISPDRHTSARAGVANTLLALRGRLKDYHVIDASYSTDRIAFYADCDLHIGYRVHAHLDFLSYRKPSILIQEDGRGLGQSLTLGTQDVSASNSDAVLQVMRLVEQHLDTRFAAFHEPVERMQKTYTVMREFIESL